MRNGDVWRRLMRNVRAARGVARTARDSHRPLLAHIVPMRRCNLTCGYCNEHQPSAGPVPLARVERWLDRLAELETAFVTISGGEPLLHPRIVEIVQAIRERGMLPGLITNGFLLTSTTIEALNDAGLDYLQISIDNVEPDEVSRKSLRLLEPRLQSLASFARFDVNINSVLGTRAGREEDVRSIGERARELGFGMSVGVIHDEAGRLKPLSDGERAVWEEFNGKRTLRQFFGNFYSALNGFQRNLVAGKPNDWKCRGGARYLYVSEDGAVGRCSQHRGTPGIDIELYTRDDVQREFTTVKPCASYCTIGCVHKVSVLDWWLDPFRTPAPVPPLPTGERVHP
jgi:MoaA/NifB/PqqE/SkfB family radical SAM enzyme